MHTTPFRREFDCPAATLCAVRLSTEHRLALKAHFSQELGDDCEVLLFGSRIDDDRLGGDVDMLVRTPRLLDNRAWLAAKLAARAERLLGGRRVDVLLLDLTTSMPQGTIALAGYAVGVKSSVSTALPALVPSASARLTGDILRHEFP